jgi:MFS family permease
VKIRERLAKVLGFRGNILPIVSLELISNVGWNMYEAVRQPFILSLGATVTILGALDGFSLALRSLLQPFMGRISDRLGRKRPIYFSHALCIVGLSLLFVAKSWLWLVPALISFAIADSIWDPIFPTLISESVNEERRGEAFSLWSLTWSIPGFFAPALGGLIAENFGFKPIMVLTLVGEFLAFAVFILFVRETLTGRKELRIGDFIGSLTDALRPPSGLSRFYAAAILGQFIWFMGEGLLPAMLVKAYDFTLIQLGVLANVMSLSIVIFQIPFGRLVDRYGGKPFLLLSSVLWSIIFLGYMASRSFASFVIFKVLRGIVAAAWQPAYNAYISRAVPDDERARTYGDINCLRGLICFPAPIIGALLFENYGFSAPLWAGLVLSVMAFAIFTTVR